MINRDTHKELCEKYQELEKELEFWKQQAYTIQERNKKLTAQLSLWKGTAP